ncbi:uncharacterized protein BJ212DRAFT_1449163 [Suillus subaureus]|uniref:Uncharacterized protein n=1 Tax=Suillus subaureus TaxID=48587 RepID=A0A9P7E152_9AGAM|nr:uncharacterized protein BJ212DRAFT_1449163 [Suillus subaureus]KAG1808040.1 hypothetical protein BJ212DRAFT_1449163 [Suillus subaureus]
MCPDTCVAFTGPFANLTHCPICHTEHYDPIKLCTSGGQMYVARQKFVTIPLGAQLQALWRDLGQAQEMSYLQEETQCLLAKLQTNGGVIDVFDDFFKGCEYIQAVQWGDIKPDDVVLMISLNGAQLYESKGFIPGPNKLKNVNSFLFPGMHHLAALQNEGLHIWDAWHDIMFISHPFLIFITANGPGLVSTERYAK